MATATRLEHDLLGDIDVPQEALYGAQTQRALLNFPIGKEKTIGDYPSLVEALLLIKQAAASANLKIGALSEKKAQAIIESASELLKDRQFTSFPIHALHGGGGTSANMNANEVLANLAEEALGGQRGEYKIVHPNDHINLNQSTNDVYPTACHIAIIRHWPGLESDLQKLNKTFLAKSEQWSKSPRIARTCLQDAVAITFKDLIGGYMTFIERCCTRTGEAVEKLYEINLGGTIVGRSSDVPSEYFTEIIPALIRATGETKYTRSSDLFDAAQNPDTMVAVSSQLNLLARGLIKIGNDLRWLSSGPETGLGEIQLPPAQPGSSIMPGKINPVIPEFLMQLCFQVMGKHTTCESMLNHGELDLNIWESVIVFNILDSMELLSNAVSTFDQKCIAGLEINQDLNKKNAETIIPLLTSLVKKHGYSKISSLCQKASGNIDKLLQILKENDLL